MGLKYREGLSWCTGTPFILSRAGLDDEFHGHPGH